ncbi:hypothetical protein ABH966_002354 [Lysinibacillus sp. RC46]|uniref:hypothetical protein n=2 Tax=Lysinibacillus TaxID=400634 RepID=UPI0035146001
MEKNNAMPNAFYHSSVAAYGYAANYDKARSYWNGSSKVNITKTTSSAGRPDIYSVGTTSVSGLLGQAGGYNSSGSAVSLDSNWDYATSIIYDNQMRAQSNYTASRINFNAAHEVGHTIKMAHVGIPHDSVMVQGWWEIPSGLTSYDSGEINKKW